MLFLKAFRTKVHNRDIQMYITYISIYVPVHSFFLKMLISLK